MKHNLIIPFLFLVATTVSAQKENLNRVVAGFPVNYEEESVVPYTLPDVLKMQNGRIVKDSQDWRKNRRPELVSLFEQFEYGRMPATPAAISFDLFDKGTLSFGGRAIRKQVTVYLTGDRMHKMDLLVYLPAQVKKPVPLLLMISFMANNQVVDDPGIRQGTLWTRTGEKIVAENAGRFGKIDILPFLDAGIGFATVYYGDIEPDFKTGIQYGIRSAYLKPGEAEVPPDGWGAISAWAWGLSRAMDYFEKDQDIDARRIALQGTSRLGKTVLWAGAHDTRIKMVIASCSGEGGAAISRRDYGENIKHLTDTSRYYYQFAPNYHSFAYRVNDLPFDAHMLVALMAPRALLLQTGDTDYWSDPKGEFLSARAAEPVYQLFGEMGPGLTNMPEAGDSTHMNKLGYYMHAGGHGTIPSDWPLFIAYMKKFL